MNLPPCKKTALFTIAASLFASTSLLAQSNDLQNNNAVPAVSAAGGGIGALIGLAIGLIVIIGMWKIFVKAGQPGWASIIPIYNAYILCKIVGKPGWWVILLFIPLVGVIIGIILVAGLAKSFGKGVGFAVGLILLPFIFYPMLGFGDASYRGPAA
jgi:hypothetical protein